MSESYRRTATGSFIIPERGIIEIISLDTEAQDASAILYEGKDVAGRRLFDIRCQAQDSRTTPALNLAYNGGLYATIPATGSGLTLTVK